MLKDQLKKIKKGIMAMMVIKAMPVMGEHGSRRVADPLLSKAPTGLSTCGLMGLAVGLDDLSSPFQSYWFYGSTPSICMAST